MNYSIVKEVAIGLKELKDIMVFVGAATISLYADDPAADEIRPTTDIDMTVKLALNYAECVKINVRLSELGFVPNPNGHAICSYLFNKINVDIMASKTGPLGKANKWYGKGFKNIKKVQIEGEEIQVLNAPCFLATKFEAFKARGRDYRTSHDFEDIIYILDNRVKIVEEIKNAGNEIRDFVKEQLQIVLNQSNSDKILACHIHPLIFEGRFPILKQKIIQIVE